MCERVHNGLSLLDSATYLVDSPAAMRYLGELLGSLLQSGDVVVLTGSLGAGKTQLAKGVAQGLGVREDVTSPTFAIINAYQGAEMPLYHVDLYRLSGFEELEDTGIFDILGEGVCLIEWGELFSRQLGEERLDIFIERMDEPADNECASTRLVRMVACDLHSSDIIQALDALVRDMQDG